MRRRDFITLLGGAAAWPLAAAAQTPRKIPRVGWISGNTSTAVRHFLEATRQGLRDLGYVEGQTIMLEIRYAEGRYERLPELVSEMVRLGVDVTVVATTPGALAAKNATQTIPIVMVAVGDAVGSGLVASLARPGGNLTGVSMMHPEISGKRLELLNELVPRLARVAVLRNPSNPIHTTLWQETQVAARKLAVELSAVEVRGPEDLEGAFEAATRGKAEALLAFDDSLTLGHNPRSWVWPPVAAFLLCTVLANSRTREV